MLAFGLPALCHGHAAGGVGGLGEEWEQRGFLASPFPVRAPPLGLANQQPLTHRVVPPPHRPQAILHHQSRTSTLSRGAPLLGHSPRLSNERLPSPCGLALLRFGCTPGHVPPATANERSAVRSLPPPLAGRRPLPPPRSVSPALIPLLWLPPTEALADPTHCVF